MKKNALISVYDKKGIVEFAQNIVKCGFTIYSTGGTLKHLKENNIKVNSISEYIDFPVILDGRVKTLHPKIYGGILSNQSKEEHLQELIQNNIEVFQLVVVNLYPFERVVQNKDSEAEEIIENIDIGGPCLLRAAAKNHEQVIVLSSPQQYPMVTDQLLSESGEVKIDTRRQLATEAFFSTSRYDAHIAKYFSFNSRQSLSLKKIQNLRYGENPHQSAAVYSDEQSSLFRQQTLHQGKGLSYNNFLDFGATYELLSDFPPVSCSIFKHTSPCGVAMGSSPLDAFQKAYSCDPQSSFGGIVGLNCAISEDVAEAIASHFFEGIIVPEIDARALAIFAKKPKLRVLSVPFDVNNLPNEEWRSVFGFFLYQERDNVSQQELENTECVTKKKPTEQELEDLWFAWKVVRSIKSNAIVCVKNQRTIGIGAGHVSRVGAVEWALNKAQKKDLEGASLASDAFFPFRDSVDLCAQFGIRSIIQPGGSIRDKESIDACNENNMSMLFTHHRHFKH